MFKLIVTDGTRSWTSRAIPLAEMPAFINNLNEGLAVTGTLEMDR